MSKDFNNKYQQSFVFFQTMNRINMRLILAGKDLVNNEYIHTYVTS